MNGDTEAIKSKLNEYYEAFNNKKWEKFSELLAEDFICFSDNAVVMNRQQFVDFLIKDLWQGRSFNIEDLMVNISNDNTLGIAAYKICFIGYMNNKEVEVNAIESTTFKRVDDEWKVIHSHISNKY